MKNIPFQNRNDYLKAMLGMGGVYLDNSKFLYDEKGLLSGFELLFIHAIEILLKAFILLSDPREIEFILDDFKNKFGHDYLKLMYCAKRWDDENILSKKVYDAIKFTSENFYKDSIDVRYTKAYRERSFDLDSFKIIKEELLAPILKVYIERQLAA